MTNRLYKLRYLILRRITQVGLLFLYFAGNAWGWSVLKGTLSASLVFDTIPLADPFAVLQMLSAGALMGVNVFIGTAIILLFYGIVGGRAFCSWVCPVNMVTDLANWLRRVLLLDKVERKVWVSRNARYWVLGLSLIVSAITGLAAFELVSPITIFNRGVIFGMGMTGGVLLAIFLFDLFGVKNGWCGHICPLGGFYSLIGRYSLIRVYHNEPNCTLCMKCKEVCPETQVLYMIGKKSQIVDMGECVNCARCIEVCDDDALGFSLRSFATNKAKGEKR
ncbi:quinol dehydrogenase ferredoxin subunit NapH [Hydrogenimonas sp.]